MRKFMFIGAALLLAAACNSGKQYTVKGTITGDSESLVNGKAYLFNRDRENPVRDTAEVINGVFEFKGSLETSEPYLITIEGIPGMLPLFLENDRYTITGVDTAYTESVIKGGKAQTMLSELNAEVTALADEYGMNALIIKLRIPTTPQDERDSLMAVYGKYQAECDSIKNLYVAKDPVSNFSLYFLDQDFFSLPIDSVEYLVGEFKLRPEFSANRILARVDSQLQTELSLQPGNPCIDFTMDGPDGKPVTLSDIYRENKVTMIDFWAGWCGPCRMFNPTLVEIYKEYHSKGFEILGVSLDRNADDWKNAIKADKLTWPQVSDLKFWESEAAAMYNVRYIPQNVFVDSDGNILGRRLGEDEIVSLLEEHLN